MNLILSLLLASASCCALAADPAKPVLPVPLGLTAQEATIWTNLNALPYIKGVQFMGAFIDPKILDTKQIRITVDGKPYVIDGDYVPYHGVGQPTSWLWQGRGQNATAEFYGDIARERPLYGQVALENRHFRVAGRFLIEYVPGTNHNDTPPQRASRPSVPASGVQQ